MNIENDKSIILFIQNKKKAEPEQNTRWIVFNRKLISWHTIKMLFICWYQLIALHNIYQQTSKKRWKDKGKWLYENFISMEHSLVTFSCSSSSLLLLLLLKYGVYLRMKWSLKHTSHKWQHKLWQEDKTNNKSSSLFFLFM